jgi:hypothetical protein
MQAEVAAQVRSTALNSMIKTPSYDFFWNVSKQADKRAGQRKSAAQL